jgi:2-amino-4-hydroxy-6-hydroxymethyldihydropteridine diphosphokinase
MTIAYIGLGSNLANPEQQIHDAIDAFEQLPHVTMLKVSPLYYSRPMGPQDQPDYMNAVISVETELSPIDLLDTLQNIEHEAGRIRKDNRWGPRVLDLDILLYGERVINTERLTVPHYGMKVREFVLIPLAEIAPDLILPDGSSVRELSESIPHNQLKVHSKLR